MQETKRTKRNIEWCARSNEVTATSGEACSQKEGLILICHGIYWHIPCLGPLILKSNICMTYNELSTNE